MTMPFQPDVLYGNPLVYAFKSIVKEAKSELVIISPFIQLIEEYKELLSSSRGALSLQIFYSGKEQEIENWVNCFDEFSGNIRVFHLKDMHSKVYLNEKEALLTSKNFYEKKDGIHNEEIGVLFHNSTKGYKSIRKYVKRLSNNSKEKKKITRWE